MKKFPKPWFRPSRNLWYVTLEGVQHNLGSDKARAFERYKELLKDGPKESTGSPLVEDLAVEFITWCVSRRASGTVALYKHRLESFLAHTGDITVDQLTPLHLDRWCDSHPKWNDGMKRNSMAAVQRCLNWAVKKGLIKHSPIASIEKPPAGNRETLITKKVHDKIMGCFTDAAFKELLSISWETGARPQETLIVEAIHVDLERGTWTFPVKQSKGKKRNRVIYLNEAALELTRSAMERYPSGPLFRNSHGKPWTKGAVNTRFYTASKKLGHKYCLYLYRHSWVTRKLIAGVDSHVLAKLAGHSSTQMIDTVYSKVAQDAAFMREQAGKE